MMQLKIDLRDYAQRTLLQLIMPWKLACEMHGNDLILDECLQIFTQAPHADLLHRSPVAQSVSLVYFKLNSPQKRCIWWENYLLRRGSALANFAFAAPSTTSSWCIYNEMTRMETLFSGTFIVQAAPGWLFLLAISCKHWRSWGNERKFVFVRRFVAELYQHGVCLPAS